MSIYFAGLLISHSVFLSHSLPIRTAFSSQYETHVIRNVRQLRSLIRWCPNLNWQDTVTRVFVTLLPRQILPRGESQLEPAFHHSFGNCVSETYASLSWAQRRRGRSRAQGFVLNTLILHSGRCSLRLSRLE